MFRRKNQIPFETWKTNKLIRRRRCRRRWKNPNNKIGFHRSSAGLHCAVANLYRSMYFEVAIWQFSSAQPNLWFIRAQCLGNWLFYKQMKFAHTIASHFIWTTLRTRRTIVIVFLFEHRAFEHWRKIIIFLRAIQVKFIVHTYKFVGGGRPKKKNKKEKNERTNDFFLNLSARWKWIFATWIKIACLRNKTEKKHHIKMLGAYHLNGER